MKKILAVVLSVMFLGVVSAPVFAQTTSSTPAAKAHKTKKTHKKKTMKKKAKASMASGTPAAK